MVIAADGVIVETAAAKINLTLDVLGRRADGYHEISSLVVFAPEIADIVTLDVNAATGVVVDGPFGGQIVGENLIARALREISAAAPDVHIGAVTLTKTLPVAAGVGGGSADAAAVLRAVSRAHPLLATRLDWHGIALGLGADVPVCLDGRPTWMRGIGERLRPLDRLPGFSCVLVNPMTAVPDDKTAQVFRQLAAAPFASNSMPPAEPSSFADYEALLDWLSASGNDLTAAAVTVVPALADVLDELSQIETCRLARVSGAGPTGVGLFASRAHADAARQRIAAAHPDWWVQSGDVPAVTGQEPPG